MFKIFKKKRRPKCVKEMMAIVLADKTGKTETELMAMSREEIFRLWEKYDK